MKKLHCWFVLICSKCIFVTSLSIDASFPDLNDEPERQDGIKFTYERDFLLQFKAKPMCMLKPEGLPDLEIVLGKQRTPSKSGFSQNR